MTIKSRLLLTIFSIFLASTVFMGLFSHRSQVNRLQESLAELARNESRLFQTMLATDAEGLTRAQTGLVRIDPLLRLFAQREREALYSECVPLFAELRQERNITHMYFIEPDGTVFLRVHRPEQFGDRLTRTTFVRAAETRSTASGLEMGRNFFSLRCVTPLFSRGELIGYLEIAQEIDHIFEQMKAVTGHDVSLFLTRDFLKSYNMDFHTEIVGEFAILYPTNKNVSLPLASSLTPLLQKGMEEFTVAFADLRGAKYAVAIGPIRDAHGVTAGVLFSQRDISPLYSAMWKGILTSITAFGAIFLACTLLLYLSMRRSLTLFDTLKHHIQTVTGTWDLTRRLEVDTRDEIGELADDFNLMKKEILKLQQKLEARAEELSAANRELEAFSYSLSHDLRLPLTRVYSSAQILEEGYAGDLDETGNFLVRTICEASEGMEELIEAMLVLSRTTRSEMVPQQVDLGGIARQIAAELQLSEPGRKVEFIIPAGLVATGDPQLLKVALRNLLENAWKYSRAASAPQIEVGKIEQHQKPVFFVRDNGVGFKMEEAERLFKPFQRLHDAKEFPGTGIGLTTVQRIIHRHGGTIWGKGEPGKGATFFFTLP